MNLSRTSIRPGYTLPSNVKQECPPATDDNMACMALVRTDVATTSPSGFGPADLQSAYNLAASAASAGGAQTVAVIDSFDDPSATADLAVYRQHFGLPACDTTTGAGCLVKVTPEGLPPANAAWATQESLDVDMVSAICPRCRIMLVEAPSASLGDLNFAIFDATLDGATSLSLGFAGREDNVNGEGTTLDRYLGVAISAAAGNNGYGVQYPASSQFVTAVGGTTLTMSGGSRVAETAWPGSGSGCSVWQYKPSWQADAGCANRTQNDVAAVADPETGVAFYDTYQSGGWREGGGTNVSSAIIASVYALAGAPAPGTYPASYPYRNPAALNDLTSGADGTCTPAYLCTAQAGYDGPTGLGTPNGTGAFALGGVTGDIITPFLSSGSLNASTDVNTTSNTELVVLAPDSGAGEASTLQFTASGLPPGMTIATSTQGCGTGATMCAGVISGEPTSHGSYPVTVTATDSTGASGSITFTIIVTNAVGIAPPGGQSSVVGTEITPLQIQGGDSEPGQTLTFTATGLPPGLSIASTGALTADITGTVTTVGIYNVTITATDLTGAHASVTFQWAVHGVITITASPGNLSDYTGTPVLLPFKASDSVAGATLSYDVSGLPPGVGVSSTGAEAISGWPVTPGTYKVGILVTDNYGAEAGASFTWTVNPAPDAGPTGPVHLDLGGKCLDDTGNSSTNGTKIQIWSCNGGAAQNWTVVQDGTLRINGKCLDTLNESSANGTKGVLEPCKEITIQQWNTLDPASLFKFGAHIALVNWSSGTVNGLCLDDTGKSTVNGTQVQIWQCNGGTNQAWILPAGPVASVVPGKCMDDAGDSAVNGNKIQLWTCNGGRAQNWRVEPDGTVRINGKCLDVTNHGTTAGTPLQLWTCNGGANQQWSVSPAFPVPTVTWLVNPVSELCLADPAANTTSGTRLVLGECANFNSISPVNPGTFWHIK